MSFTIKNKNYQSVIQKKLEKQYFMKHIAFEIKTIEPGLVYGGLKIKQEHLQQNGFLHGGVTATVADLVMGFAAFTLVAENEGTVTSDLKIAYLRPGIGDEIIAKGYVVKQGNLLFFCEADIICINKGEEVLIARGYSTMCAIKTE